MASMAGDCENTDEAQVKITINREKNTLTISDNGIGMNDEEIKKYINQVAFSSAEEFLTKYKKDNDEFIGHFGLGFYSSFMVADRVDILSSFEDGNIKIIGEVSDKFWRLRLIFTLPYLGSQFVKLWDTGKFELNCRE